MDRMNDYDAATYGDRIADVYDTWGALSSAETEQTVAFLAALAGAGPVLELGIGTGRVAVPLAQRGLAVAGIDASEAMVAQLRAKPGGEGIPVTMGSFAEMWPAGPFRLIYVVFNTFFGLLTQEEQVRCFAEVGGHLTADGVFVLEAFVPDPTRFTHGQATHTSYIDSRHVRLDVSHHDPLGQRVTTQHVVIGEDGVRLYPVQIRYAWPSELDLMARLAALRLRERWSSWHREPFTSASTRHISVYEPG
jgi:SAM-dependent methyltransferase